MDRHSRARTVERVLFLLLISALAASGFFYERFRAEMPAWQLAAMICVGMSVSYGAYRVALYVVVRRLGP